MQASRARADLPNRPISKHFLLTCAACLLLGLQANAQHTIVVTTTDQGTADPPSLNYDIDTTSALELGYTYQHSNTESAINQ